MERRKRSKSGSIFPSPSWQELTRGRSLKGRFRAKGLLRSLWVTPFLVRRDTFFFSPSTLTASFYYWWKIGKFFIYIFFFLLKWVAFPDSTTLETKWEERQDWEAAKQENKIEITFSAKKSSSYSPGRVLAWLTTGWLIT